ncbi:hypothetical protein ACFVFJ_44265 [Streptomyces sp. NPDC057717]|uniref:hypothetical protein n=1 Tax=Streptomyces sp. NPDC057717 TaxID=3346224 RepID=UPI0036BB0A71
MSLPVPLHASTRRDEPPTCDPVTGEVRVPLALYAVDVHQGDIELVLSRAEAQPVIDALLRAAQPRLEVVS